MFQITLSNSLRVYCLRYGHDINIISKWSEQESGVKHIFGLNDKKNTSQNVVINTQELINGHLLLTGMSGTGKSYQAKRLIKTAIQQNLEVDIFDVHNELEQPVLLTYFLAV